MASGAQTPADNPGIELDELDPEVRPADDLFRHVNGKWIARTEIPSDKARYGSFYVLAEEAEKAVRDIIEEARSGDPGTEERKIGDLFASFLDEPAIEARGWGAVAPDFEAIDARRRTSPRWSPSSGASSASAPAASCRPSSTTTRATPSATWSSSSRAASACPTSRTTARRSSPTSARRTARTSSACSGWRGWPSRRPRAERVLELETALAGHHWDNVRTRDSNATYNPMHWAEVEALGGGSAPRRLARRDGRPGEGVRRGRRARAELRRGARRAARREPPRRLARLAALAGHPLGGSLPPQRGRAGELRLLRQDAHRHARAAGTVEARGLRRRGRAGRGRRAHLRRPALHARPRRPRWMRWWPTWSRRIATASRTWSG